MKKKNKKKTHWWVWIILSIAIPSIYGLFAWNGEGITASEFGMRIGSISSWMLLVIFILWFRSKYDRKKNAYVFGKNK